MCAAPQSALSKLAVGVLQRPFDALLQDCTQRLKVMYIGAGLISDNDDLVQRDKMSALRPTLSSILLFVGLLCLTEVASARVQILLSHATPPYRALADAISADISGQSISIVDLEAEDTSPQTGIADTLNIAIGSRAMIFALKEMPKIPLLVTLVPSNAYEALLQSHGRATKPDKISAVFPDQPLARQVAFVRLLMPDKRRMGILVGQHSYQYVQPLRRLAPAYGLTLQIGDAREDRISDAIKRMIAGSDFVLALHDSSLLTPNHAKWLLYMAYQRRIPVIGYSRTYVKAGALAALFSSEEQIAHQVASILSRSGLQDAGQQAGHIRLPKPEYPNDFSIEVNHSVAYSFAIRRIDIQAITDQLHRSDDEGRLR